MNPKDETSVSGGHNEVPPPIPPIPSDPGPHKASGISAPTAGQRLDQFLSKAKRLGAAAAIKAKEAADVAAPKLKEFGHAASAKARELSDKAAPVIKHASATVAERSKEFGSAASKEFENHTGKSRKVMWYAICGFTGLLLVVVMANHFQGTVLRRGSGSDSSTGGFSADNVDATLTWWQGVQVPMWEAFETGNAIAKRAAVDQVVKAGSTISTDKIAWILKVDAVDEKWVRCDSSLTSEPYDIHNDPNDSRRVTVTIVLRRPGQELSDSGATLGDGKGTLEFAGHDVPPGTYGPIWLKVGSEIPLERAGKLKSGDTLKILAEVNSISADAPNNALDYSVPYIPLVLTISNVSAANE